MRIWRDASRTVSVRDKRPRSHHLNTYVRLCSPEPLLGLESLLMPSWRGMCSHPTPWSSLQGLYEHLGMPPGNIFSRDPFLIVCSTTVLAPDFCPLSPPSCEVLESRDTYLGPCVRLHVEYHASAWKPSEIAYLPLPSPACLQQQQQQ